MAVRYEEEEKPEVQLTSMMDCIFLMLIFFLVSSQLKKVEKELPIELPRANTTRDVKSTPDLITVSVNAKGELFVNSKPVGDAGLKNALANAAKENPDRRIRINGDVVPLDCPGARHLPGRGAHGGRHPHRDRHKVICRP